MPESPAAASQAFAPAQPGACRRAWQPGCWRWPLPALAAWTAGWLCALVGQALGWPAAGLALGLLASLALALGCGSRWRQMIAALGFPLSAAALGATAQLPPWAWLPPVFVLLAAYPMRAWRDAPLFPTPAGALQGLEAVVGSPARVMDAGCGMGHGLAALRALWPQARLQGVEWSPLLARLARWRCPDALVVQGDMWEQSWADHDLVYLFQRPESMARAWDKARRELAPQAWLVSLEFAVPGVVEQACLAADGRRPVWIYASPARQSALNRGGTGPITPARPTRRNHRPVAPG